MSNDMCAADRMSHFPAIIAERCLSNESRYTSWNVRYSSRSLSAQTQVLISAKQSLRHPSFTGCWSKRTNNGHVVKPRALNHNCKSPCAFNRGHLIIRKKYTNKKTRTSNIWSFFGGLKFDPYPHLFVVGLGVAACQCGACQTRIFLNEGNAFRFVIDEGHNVHLARHTFNAIPRYPQGHKPVFTTIECGIGTPKKRQVV